MTEQVGTPRGALVAISDMLDSCVKLEPGQEVLIVADINGLHGGDSLVDQEAISWIQSGVQARGANASVLWIDARQEADAWRIPPVALAAMAGCDMVINNAFFDLPTTELADFRAYFKEKNFKMLRNFASTAPLLCSAWAQTPYELVSKIRYQASLAFKAGASLCLTDPMARIWKGPFKADQDRGDPWGRPLFHAPGATRQYVPLAGIGAHTRPAAGCCRGLHLRERLSWWSRYMA